MAVVRILPFSDSRSTYRVLPVYYVWISLRELILFVLVMYLILASTPMAWVIRNITANSTLQLRVQIMSLWLAVSSVMEHLRNMCFRFHLFSRTRSLFFHAQNKQDTIRKDPLYHMQCQLLLHLCAKKSNLLEIGPL